MSRPTIADIAVAAAAVLGGVALVNAPPTQSPAGEAVIIRSVSDSTRVVRLSEERILMVRGALGETAIKIGDGRVEFLSSPCPHGTCVERGRVGAQGEYIVCVPNGVSARITGGSDFDAVVP